MEPDFKKQVEERIAELPPDIRAAIQSTDLTKTMQGIANAHQLHLDQMDALEDEVMLVMLGFADPGEFQKHVEDEVHVPSDVANAITKEVSEQIFLPIRESLKKFLDQRTQRAEVEAVPFMAQTMNDSSKNIPQSATSAPAPVQAMPVPATPVSAPAPVPTPAAAPNQAVQSVVAPAPAAPAAPAPAPTLPAADVMLTQKTVTPPAAPATPAAPDPAAQQSQAPIEKGYVADPYREPIE